MVVCTHCGLHYVGTAARRQPLPLGNSPPSAPRSTRPKPPSTATWAPSRPAPCLRPSAASVSRPSAPSLVDLQARELELQQALAASATQELPTPADLEELASQLRQVIEHAPVTAKKALEQQLVHEIHVTGRDDVRPTFRIPTRPEPSPGEARRFVSWSGRSQPASIRTFHRLLRVRRFGWPGVTPRSGARGIGIGSGLRTWCSHDSARACRRSELLLHGRGGSPVRFRRGLHQQGKPAYPRAAGGGGLSSRPRSRSRPLGDGRLRRLLFWGLLQPFSSYEVRFPVAEAIAVVLACRPPSHAHCRSSSHRRRQAGRAEHGDASRDAASPAKPSRASG
jgi:hypothetical protein